MNLQYLFFNRKIWIMIYLIASSDKMNGVLTRCLLTKIFFLVYEYIICNEIEN